MNVKNQLFLLACSNTSPEVLRNLFNISLNWADAEDRKLLFRLYIEACETRKK